jgi:hypothetical protein
LVRRDVLVVLHHLVKVGKCRVYWRHY